MSLTELSTKINIEVNNISENLESLATGTDVAPLLIAYQKLRDEYALIDKARLNLYHLKNQMDKVILPELFEKLGIDKLAVAELSRSYYVIPKSSATMADKIKAFEWLRENGGDDLISETVNAGTLNSLLRELLEETGVLPPEEIIKFSTFKMMGSSTYTPKK